MKKKFQQGEEDIEKAYKKLYYIVQFCYERIHFLFISYCRTEIFAKINVRDWPSEEIRNQIFLIGIGKTF